MIAEIQDMVGTGALTIAPFGESSAAERDLLTAENGSLRLLLAQAASLAYEPTGFIYTLNVPLKSLTTKT
jgi:hypothetical protein